MTVTSRYNTSEYLICGHWGKGRYGHRGGSCRCCGGKGSKHRGRGRGIGSCGGCRYCTHTAFPRRGCGRTEGRIRECRSLQTYVR